MAKTARYAKNKNKNTFWCQCQSN